ncbi:hypothetical protein [Geitlerinema sp. PCC 7407]|jgi:hypothetical protein|uniref:hypothetical protein n=1 Tax=Geitlerinema sp. PCC 7407 TaxID=1173025 RepID=UPI00029FABC4|nr:hypothetical protein [Geitlerinema sp. PCC 7407]AFY67809.1 hypothetical protein GEI7407_3342 [Geitlerinema sp. PCC 7407]
MSAQDQARALMMRHHQMIKNRQQCLLGRSAVEVGIPIDEAAQHWTHIQGKPSASFGATYDRSHASFS